MRFDTSQFPLISETTSFHFVDARMSEQELKARHRRETAKNIAIACVNSDNHHIRLTFTDNGQGISSTALKHIFDRYNRGDHQNDKSVKGHGQGLHYARLVIKAHHGTIAIDSPPGSGTSVIVTLPISKD